MLTIMKKLNILLGSLILLASATSCNDFLNLTPRDQKVVSTVEDYRDIMASFMYYMKTPEVPQQVTVFGIDNYTVPFHSDIHNNLAIYTGETNINTNSSVYYNKQSGDYTQTGRSMLTWTMTNADAWSRYYGFLGPINLIISDIATAEGDEQLRNYVKGEALVWRAYTFYKLLQFYAPYDKDEYGVPVYLTPQLEIGTTMPARESQRAVFAQIFADLQEALDLLTVTQTNEWNLIYRKDFINAMLASVYTWKAMSGAADPTDWSKAEACATEAMKGRTLSNSPALLKQIFNCSTSEYTRHLDDDEFFTRWVDGEWTDVCDLYEAYVDGNTSDGVMPASYQQLFQGSDIRSTAWVQGNAFNKYSMRGEIGRSRGCLMPFRLAEMYLIKAEALYRQGRESEAAGVLTQFCTARYTALPSIPSSGDELLQAILRERDIEFYQEADFRWLDMKRLNLKLDRTIAGQKYTLEPGDFRYAFPIPAREMQLNKNIVQNPGWESIIIY